MHLGVIGQTLGSGKVVTEIMTKAVKYVPTRANGEDNPILVSGDQASIEKLVWAKFNMAISKLLFFKVGIFVIGRI